MSWLVGWRMGQHVSSLFLLWYGGALLLACASTLKLPPLPSQAQRRLYRDAAVVARQPAVFVLLLTTFLVSSSTSIFYTYFGIYLTGMGATAGFVGTATAMAGLSELPVLFFGAWLMRRFGSRRLILLAIGLYALRFGLYTVLPSAGWVLPIQLVHGLTYGAYLMASVSLAHKLVPLALAATAQGLLTSMALGFGMIAGALLGGALLDHIGVAPLFGVAALIMLLALIVFGVGFQVPQVLSNGVEAPTLQ
jgi:PPP family 3-phenylpropionic acid transporter